MTLGKKYRLFIWNSALRNGDQITYPFHPHFPRVFGSKWESYLIFIPKLSCCKGRHGADSATHVIAGGLKTRAFL